MLESVYFVLPDEWKLHSKSLFLKDNFGDFLKEAEHMLSAFCIFSRAFQRLNKFSIFHFYEIFG